LQLRQELRKRAIPFAPQGTRYRGEH
jgi:hypothetical protein